MLYHATTVIAVSGRPRTGPVRATTADTSTIVICGAAIHPLKGPPNRVPR